MSSEVMLEFSNWRAAARQEACIARGVPVDISKEVNLFPCPSGHYALVTYGGNGAVLAVATHEEWLEMLAEEAEENRQRSQVTNPRHPSYSTCRQGAARRRFLAAHAPGVEEENHLQAYYQGQGWLW